MGQTPIKLVAAGAGGGGELRTDGGKVKDDEKEMSDSGGEAGRQDR